MTKLLIGSLVIFFFTSCRNNQKLDKDLVYSTLNEIIQQDSIFADVVCRRFDIIDISEEIEAEFFKNDKDFIQDQLKQSVYASIETGRLFFYWKKKDT